MKLILAIFRDPHYEKINQALISSGFRTTLVASTSGWLKKGVTTLLIGVEDSDVDKAIETIRKIVLFTMNGAVITRPCLYLIQ